jgi:M6 family metalloprotease-like protein
MTAPFFGEQFTFTQPDGTRLAVRGWGDERHAVFETLDGFTVVSDPVTGFYQYALPSADGETLEASGVRPGVARPEALAIPRGVRLDPAVARASAALTAGLPRSRWEERRDRARAEAMAFEIAAAHPGMAPQPAPPSRHTVGDYVGLCLLIDFPDVPRTIPQDEVEAFCNQPGYGGFGNAGSVRDYFFDNSNGALRYTTVVAPYYTAREQRAYYTDPLVPYPSRTRQLIREALAHHLSRGFDFGSLTADSGGYVFATNVFYAGARVNNWKKGLWPHASRLLTPFPLAPGRAAFDYQITDMGASLALGTYCHENGHLLCDFPDLYDPAVPHSAGVGAFCLMGGGGSSDPRNPSQFGAYLKYRAGWARTVHVAAPGLAVTLRAGVNEFVLHTRSPGEYFLIENRHRSGRDAALPDSGVAIWHVDEAGDNAKEQRTPADHYECSLIQADGRNDLERGTLLGDSNDLYHAGWRDRFAGDTLPASVWWDGSPSGLEVHGIGPDGPTVTLRVDV